MITRTPKHYFFNQGGDPSGEALIAMESPLNKKAQDSIDRFYPVWQQIGIFICQIENIAITGDDVSPQFDKPETIQPRTTAEIIKLNTDAGMPLDTALTVAGWTDGEIETMNQIKNDNASKAQTSLAAALLKAQQDMKNLPMPPSTKVTIDELGSMHRSPMNSNTPGGAQTNNQPPQLQGVK
jgi:Phage portal protein, SPP1 Gp6-like